jgi:hypothetical protein
MSRFLREISGQLGDFWKKSAEEEVIKAVKLANEDSIVETDGAIKWKKSGNYVPDDLCEKLEYAGFNFSREMTNNKREEQNALFFKNYRESKREIDSEQKVEMNANFEKDDIVIDVITKKKYKIS